MLEENGGGEGSGGEGIEANGAVSGKGTDDRVVKVLRSSVSFLLKGFGVRKGKGSNPFLFIYLLDRQKEDTSASTGSLFLCGEGCGGSSRHFPLLSPLRYPIRGREVGMEASGQAPTPQVPSLMRLWQFGGEDASGRQGFSS